MSINTFNDKTSPLQLSQLDENFATPITIGSTPVVLGGTVTDLASVTINGVPMKVSSTSMIVGGSTVTGTLNVILGQSAGASQTGSYNTFVGYGVGISVTGSYNTFVGVEAGYQMTSGSNNTFIGGFLGQYNAFDLRASSNNIVLSDGGGNPRSYIDVNGKHGYCASTGGTAVQSGSRTTGVTINTPTGTIQLVSAAGTTTPFTFVVTNSSIGANDCVIVTQQTGSNSYLAYTQSSAGSFKVTIECRVGTATEAPVFNFVTYRGSTN
jgi:hypothetical protein